MSREELERREQELNDTLKVSPITNFIAVAGVLISAIVI